HGDVRPLTGAFAPRGATTACATTAGATTACATTAGATTAPDAEAAEAAKQAPRRSLHDRRASPEPGFAVQATRILRRAPDTALAAGAIQVPAGGTPVNELGIVAWDGTPPLRLRASPTITTANVIGFLGFNTRVQVIQRFPGDWLLVATLDGKTGFCDRKHVWYAPEHKMPEPNARLHKVPHGEQG